MKLIIFFTVSLLITSPAKCQSFKNSIVNIDQNESKIESDQFNKTTNGRRKRFCFHQGKA